MPSDEKQVPALRNGARAWIVYSSLIRIVTASSRISTTPTIRFRRRISQQLANFADTTAPNRHEATTIAMGSGKSCAPSETWILFICGGVGLILGVVAWAMDVPDFPAHDWLNAAAVGIVSGWAATGLNQSVKQLSDKSFLLHTRCTPHR